MRSEVEVIRYGDRLKALPLALSHSIYRLAFQRMGERVPIATRHSIMLDELLEVRPRFFSGSIS
jgi:hypothetical protein